MDFIAWIQLTLTLMTGISLSAYPWWKSTIKEYYLGFWDKVGLVAYLLCSIGSFAIGIWIIAATIPQYSHTSEFSLMFIVMIGVAVCFILPPVVIFTQLIRYLRTKREKK